MLGTPSSDAYPASSWRAALLLNLGTFYKSQGFYSPKRFLLDANVFIQAKKSYYAFDVAPGFWSALVKHEKSSV